MENQNQPIYIINLPYKSMAASILLTICFGPLGLLYSNFWCALIITLLIIPGFLMPVSKTMLPSIISAMGTFWLLCTFLGTLFTARYNKKMLARYKPDINK